MINNLFETLKFSFFASEHGGKWFEIINRFEVTVVSIIKSRRPKPAILGKN